MLKNTFYHSEHPDWLDDFLQLNLLKRLENVGMNCGCEYTSFPIFKGIEKYSRYDHSLGCALITWHFTHDKVQTLASLFHDIATPCFAHTIDFMNGDYLNQESTEERTEELLMNDKDLAILLKREGILLSSISNYHHYPICDNDSPKLSCDRLEYTLGNLRNFKLASESELMNLYNDLCICKCDGQSELSFQTLTAAYEFGMKMLECSKIYVCDADRYSMQFLSEIVSKAIDCQLIGYNDLFTEENIIIEKFNVCSSIATLWNKYCSLTQIVKTPNENSRIILAKKRYIDPYIKGTGRLSTCSKAFATALNSFLDADFNYPVSAK